MGNVCQTYLLNKERIEIVVENNNSKHKETRKLRRVKPCLLSRNKGYRIIVMLNHLRNKRT